jgi:hypothetical protein
LSRQREKDSSRETGLKPYSSKEVKKL